MTAGKMFAALAMVFLSACGPAAVEGPSEDVAPAAAEAAPAPNLPQVDAELLAAPSSAFVAIEPTEIGVIGAPSVAEALGPLIATDSHADPLGEQIAAADAPTPEGVESVHFTVRESGDAAIADVVRTGLADDSVSAGHVRIEFRREPDGWYPTNAWRRSQCRRGAAAGQWSASPCP